MDVRTSIRALLCVMVWATVGAAWGEAQPSGETLGDRLTVLGVGTSLDAALKVLGVDPNSVRDPSMENGPDRLPPGVRDIRTADERAFLVDTQEKRLTRYMVMGRPQEQEGVPDDLTKEHAIAKAKAVAKAQELFDALGVSARIEDARVKYDEVSPGKLAGARWVIDASRFIKGIRSFSMASVQVSAYSGQIMDFFDTPKVVPPPSFEQKIGKEEAVARAMKFAETVGCKVKGVGTPDLELMIIPPNNSWTRKGQERPKANWNLSYLCWQVALEPDTMFSEMPPMFYVNAQTGDIIGGRR